MTRRGGNVLQKGRLCFAQALRYGVRLKERRQQLGVWEGPKNLLDDPLRAGIADEPFVCDRDPHRYRLAIEASGTWAIQDAEAPGRVRAEPAFGRLRDGYAVDGDVRDR